MNGHDQERSHHGRTTTLFGAALLAVALLFASSPAGAAPTSGGAAAAAESGKVDVNTATATELASLPGIGSSKAAAIIAEREKKPFASVDDLERVRGIGARTVDDLRSKVSVGH
jgi:competence protein ComEA